MKYVITAALIIAVAAGAQLLAHQITVRGTVAGIERTRIQVKTGREKKNETIPWYPMDASTKIFRGRNAKTFDQAAIRLGERAIVLIDHQDTGKVTTLEIRLPEK
jgi:hypothetical protein